MPPDVGEIRQWLFVYCADLSDLDILARLHDLGDGRHLNDVELAALTKFPVSTVREVLERLHSKGVVEASTDDPPRFWYAVAEPAVRERVDRIVAEYRDNPLAIISLMTTNSIERVKTDAIRTFAECFRIKGPK